MTPARTAIVGIGSNLGGRESLVRAACDLIAAVPGVTLEGRSAIRETAPLGPAQPRYLNAAVRLRTSLEPEALLDALIAIERVLGRERRERWGPRTLDLDLLWIEGEVFSSRRLDVPHPELLRRDFALRPLVELVPDARDPRDGVALASVLARLERDVTSVESPFSEAFSGDVLEHTADEGFVVRARDRADLLAAAAEAMGAIIVAPESVKPLRTVRLVVAIEPDAGDDERLFTWLAEVLYHLDGTRLALRRAAVLEDGASVIRGVLLGEDLDESRHEIRSAIKAVTWHTLEVGVVDAVWRAQVVIDV